MFFLWQGDLRHGIRSGQDGVQVDNPLPTSVDSTKRYTLVDSTLDGGARCEEAFHGAQLKDEAGNYGSLCLQDIGEGCIGVAVTSVARTGEDIDEDFIGSDVGEN